MSLKLYQLDRDIVILASLPPIIKPRQTAQLLNSMICIPSQTGERYHDIRHTSHRNEKFVKIQVSSPQTKLFSTGVY